MTRTGNTYEKCLWGDNTINILGRTMVLVHSTASHCKHFSWTSMWLLKMDKPWFFSDKPEKINFTKSLHIKVLLVNKLWFWWVIYHLKTVIRNQRRNDELTMGRIIGKQSICHFTLYDALINKSEQVCIL